MTAVKPPLVSLGTLEKCRGYDSKRDVLARGYLQVQDGGRTHATLDPLAELSPGMQVGDFSAGQVMLHLGHGGGPSTLHDDGLVMSHCGVGVAVGTLAALVGAAIASDGDRTRAISRIMRTIIWSHHGSRFFSASI